MSERSGRWELDRRSVDDAFERWLEHEPIQAEAGFVLVVYVPDRDRRVVTIVDINYG